MKKLLVLVICLMFLASCSLFTGQSETVPSTEDDAQADMPNPASVYCEENGGILEIRKDEAANEYGICLFPDGSECDEWTFYRGECSPGDSLSDSANMPNPASVYCEEQGYTIEIRTAQDGSQSGVCIFPDGSECDEWAFFSGECGPEGQKEATLEPTVIPRIKPIDPADYQGWLTYEHPEYGFSFRLPEDWVVEEDTTSPMLIGHILQIHPVDASNMENIRMTFRLNGDEVLLWPTGVGEGEFRQKGTLDIAGGSAQRNLLVCPNGEVTSMWYHQGKDEPNIMRGDLEFGIIFSAGAHCETGLSISDDLQYTGEMIIASLSVQQ